MFTKEAQQILGLGSQDNQVLISLSKSTMSVTELSKKTKIARTSLYPLLERLHNRGLVATVRNGKRRSWKLISKEKLQRKLFSLAHEYPIDDTESESEMGIVAAQESEYKVYHGREKLMQIYESLGELPRSSRLYGIQPNVSAYSVMQQFDFERLVEINQRIKDRKIIVEAVLQENFVDYYTKMLKKEKKPGKDILKAYGGRLAVTYHVPVERINFDSEVMFYGNVVIIANWRDLVAVVIKNKEVFGLILEFFESLKSIGKRVDQNPSVEELLRKY
jgi:DNA-binding MarR family transcriptional regulator